MSWDRISDIFNDCGKTTTTYAPNFRDSYFGSDVCVIDSFLFVGAPGMSYDSANANYKTLGRCRIHFQGE